MTPIENQLFSFVVTILLGFLIGITFDMYEAFRFIFRPRKLYTTLGDFFIWALLTGVAFISLMYTNLGEVRFYVFIGMGAGFLIYKKYISSYFVKVFKKVAFFLKKCLLFIFSIISYPVSLLKKILRRPLNLIKKVIHKFKRKVIDK